MRTDTKLVPIELVTPSFFITSTEKTYGNVATSSVLGSSMNAALVNKGMRISPSNKETNYIVTINSNTSQGGTSQGFTVAFLELSVIVTNTKNGETVYQESLTGIKGLQLNADAANIEAYKKGKEKIETEIAKALLDAIL
jgi:hypothetical protein